MVATITVKQAVNVKTLNISIDDMDFSEYPDLPCIKDGSWRPEIDVETGKIKNWSGDKAFSIHEKVRDSGSYVLMDEQDELIHLAENEYVPKCLCPKENGYGDYMIMDISSDGFIQNWKFKQSDVLQIMGQDDDN